MHKINKEQLGRGISKYIKNHISPSVTDMWSKRVISGIADLIEFAPDTINRVMERYPIFEMLEDEDGMYDIDVMERVLSKNIAEYGDITIELMGGEYTFNASDINSLAGMLRS